MNRPIYLLTLRISLTSEGWLPTSIFTAKELRENLK